MYEHITYDSILQRMLNRVLSKNPNLDTREGSIIYNALAPAAVEIQNMYIELDAILYDTFANTARRPYLILRAAERGLSPYSATNAILQAEFNNDVPIGSRFSLKNSPLNFIVISQISTGVFRVQCETLGSVGNDSFGKLIPINYIAGLTSAQLTALLTPGEDEEETEAFRKRYFDSLNAEAFGGNIKDYKEKVNALPGVGGVKVYPIWNGGGTVKLAIVASDYSVPTIDLIESVQTAVDPTTNQGKGVGFAPIGHVVTVTGVTSVSVDIETEITYQDGWDWDDVKSYAEAAVDSYFTELAQAWDDNDTLIVRISQIEIRFLDLPGIVDIANTTLNGVAQNLTLGLMKSRLGVMFMIRRLIDYLPPVIKDVREYQAIMTDGEQAEVSALWDAVDAAFNDQFVNSATVNGVERWENILGIKPKGTDTLDARKFRILSRLNEQLPYTLPVLKSMLQSLCGEDGYSVEVQNELYTLKVKIALVAKSNFDDVDVLLRRVVPANMIIELELKYNTWGTLKEFTWAYLKTKTWKEIKDEVLT